MSRQCLYWGYGELLIALPLPLPAPPPPGEGPAGGRVNGGSPAAELTRGFRSSARFSCPLPRGTALSDGSPPYTLRLLCIRPCIVSVSPMLAAEFSHQHCSVRWRRWPR